MTLSPNKTLIQSVRAGIGLTSLVIAASVASSYVTTIITTSQLEQMTRPPQAVNVAQNNTVQVVESIADSVVSISTQNRAAGWFGEEFIFEGAGTGIVIQDNGYILTNNHVVDGSDSLTVITRGNKELTAAVIATDPANDLAVIKVASDSGLPPAKIGDSDTIQVGEDVLAIGNALGRYRNSVTMGIISGLGRPAVTEGPQLQGSAQQLTDLIQTDAAINAGNSGGPLVNMNGEVVGINTAISGGAQNVGFAVPINHAQTLVERVK